MPNKQSPTPAAAYAKAATAGDLPAAVQAARAVVKRELFAGNLEDDPCSLAQLLRGNDHNDRPTLSSEAWAYHHAELFAALAMGIALGQLLHQDVFVPTGGDQ